MAFLEAHLFIRLARGNEAVAQRIVALGQDPTLEAIVAIAKDMGIPITPEELRAAYRQDWALRAVAENGSGAGKRTSSSAANAI